MADNITVDTITGSPVVATDQIGANHVQLIKILLGALDANDGPISSANPMPVVLTAANNNVGDVDVASVLPGNSAANLGKTVDNVVGAADTGVAFVGKRVDTPATVTPANGDYVMAQFDSQGSLRVNITSGGSQAQIDDAAFTPGTSEVVVAGFFADETSTDSIDEGEQGAARMTLDRKQIVTPYLHAAAGGATPYKSLDLDETEEEVKATAGKVLWVHAINLTAVKQYLKFYNATAANVTVGTTTPVLTFPIPTVGDTNGAGFTINFGDAGVQFSTAITIAATTGFADNDTGAPAVNAVIVNLGYI
jgi:primosomal replication protein N